MVMHVVVVITMVYDATGDAIYSDVWRRLPGIFLMLAEGELLLATLLNIIVVHIHFRGKFGLAPPHCMHYVVFTKLSRLFNFSDTVAMYQEKQRQVSWCVVGAYL